ncbi:MAG: phage tail sheath family protein [Deltaproteobacteria bacterium]|nr:phage tail sheath family protein [Deltaproteobacteria bacterium]
MAQVSYPGVYIEEVPSGVRPIAAASTSIAAFIGVAERGPVGEAVKVFNFTEYQNRYGGFLTNSFLSHAVYQFFNNGGTQCYVVRVAGATAASANIALRDRAVTPQTSLTIFANSPGAWGNQLAVVVANGTNDPLNEFNLSVFQQDELTPLERFDNLSMVPGAPNSVTTATAASRYIRVTPNTANTNAQAGTSRGAVAPPALASPRTRFRININGDGHQEIDLSAAVPTPAPDLNTAANIAIAIQARVRALTKLRTSTDQNAFANFLCEVTTTAPIGVLLLTSGVSSPSSSVKVAPAANSTQDAAGLLRLGPLNGGVETLGGAVLRPRTNPPRTPPDNYYFVGDNSVPTTEVASVVAGSDGAAITTDQPYIDAFAKLDDKEDVSLVAVPGIGSAALVGAGMNYCANRSLSDCFFIGDMSQTDDTVDEAKNFRNAITPKNSYGAIYAPWVRMLDPTGRSSTPILAPPSGFVAGLYAKTDGQRGVWKAPAGTSAALGGSVGLAVNLTDAQQGNLNPLNVNVIRQFAGSGIVLWGARTVTSDPAWNYVPVRRMAIFLRVSIYRGIQWAVFEPNDEDLWSSLRLSIGSFMMILFRQGAFQGATPTQAFFVKCDNETTTQDDINAGIVNVLVGFAPLKPAEFVIVKISQKVGQTA